MTLRRTIEVVTQLAEKRVIGSYAIAGAVAAINYIQPMLTEDLDILISIDGFEKRTSGLLLLRPIEKALAEMGYTERTNVGYKIEGWPVQFLPVASPLDEEALEQAIEIDVANEGENASQGALPESRACGRGSSKSRSSQGLSSNSSILRPTSGRLKSLENRVGETQFDDRLERVLPESCYQEPSDRNLSRCLARANSIPITPESSLARQRVGGSARR